MIFHYLRSVYEDSGSLFGAMSKDSGIASEFSCGERKANYIIRFGLAKHFQKVQVESLHGRPYTCLRTTVRRVLQPGH